MALVTYDLSKVEKWKSLGEPFDPDSDQLDPKSRDTYYKQRC